MQCIQPDEACTSVNGEIILAMMMNAKTSTKTLVVVVEGHDTVEKEGPGEWTKKANVLYRPHMQCNLYDEPAYPEYMGRMA
jgi:hypothetical protein